MELQRLLGGIIRTVAEGDPVRLLVPFFNQTILVEMVDYLGLQVGRKAKHTHNVGSLSVKLICTDHIGRGSAYMRDRIGPSIFSMVISMSFFLFLARARTRQIKTFFLSLPAGGVWVSRLYLLGLTPMSQMDTAGGSSVSRRVALLLLSAKLPPTLRLAKIPSLCCAALNKDFRGSVCRVLSSFRF